MLTHTEIRVCICVYMYMYMCVHAYVMCGFEMLSIQTCVCVCVYVACVHDVCVDACSKVPYSGKPSREKTFTNFKYSRKFSLRESFFLPIRESNFPKPTPTCT